MTDYGTIKIPQSEYEKHNERRKELNLTWAEYIDNQKPVLPETQVDYAEIETRLERVLERQIQ